MNSPWAICFNPPPVDNPGLFDVLSIELSWLIFENLLFSRSELSHDEVHGFLSVAQVSLLTNNMVNGYLSQKHVQNQLIERVQAAGPLPYKHYGRETSMLVWNSQVEDPGNQPMEGFQDLFSELIREDCPSCFAWACGIAGIDGSYCNKDCYSFLSLAVASKAVGVLKYILGESSPADALLFARARFNIRHPFNMSTHPTPLSLVSTHKDREFLQIILDLISNRIQDLNVSAVDRPCCALTAIEKIQFCEFASPDQARALGKLGFQIGSIRDRHYGTGQTTWHAAVANTTDFLDYLLQESPLSSNLLDHAGEMPLQLAVREGRLGSFQWLRDHSSPDWMNDSRVRMALLQDAVKSCAKRSPDLVNELLQDEADHCFSSRESCELLRQVTSTAVIQATALLSGEQSWISSIINGSLTSQDVEEMAVAKANLILAKTKEISDWGILRAIRGIARQWGFERLAAVLDLE
ncbi:hypothetical protein N7462_006031 [Penicillium macrosclerotiorum]|uniref:uncharacterized protein n=1 Tax=Penicillium macrosclerotiorum TaxID=303699 RepID=UPI00254936FC|nr:uncharacterized protein N7462_006031 [Penicillium macrosclerotiorum]KAJ5682866.1 hypothetical protein N7462_006031 [Penicillium macrosclerotiorum]